MYCWAWFVLTVIFTIAAVRSSWVLFMTLFILDIELVLLAVGYMVNKPSILVAANSVGFVVALCSCESSESESKSTRYELISILQIGLAVQVFGQVASRRLSSLHFQCTSKNDRHTTECTERVSKLHTGSAIY